MTISQLPHPLVASAWLVAALAMTPPAEAQTSLDFISEQGPTVDRIVKDALSQPRAHARLVTLCDRHGHRLSGSPGLEAALDWAVTTMTTVGYGDITPTNDDEKLFFCVAMMLGGAYFACPCPVSSVVAKPSLPA